MNTVNQRKVKLFKDDTPPLFLYKKYKQYLNQYKDYLVPLLIILVSIGLVFFIILPQITEIITLQNEQAILPRKIEVFKNNIALLSSVSKEESDARLKTVKSALPLDKNFVGMVQAISRSSSLTGVLVNDFSFQVGDLSAPGSKSKITDFPSLKISLSVKGNLPAISNFLKEISKSFPVVEITSVQYSGSSAVLDALFYYRPVSSLVFDRNTPLTSFSPESLNVLHEIRKWESGNSNIAEKQQNSSGSGSLLP